MKRTTTKPVQVMFADKNISRAYEKLENSQNQDDRKLFAQIKEAIDELKKDPFCGIEIPKKIIPKRYIQLYEVDNLWKYDMRNGWRLIYTNVADEVKILSVVLEWFDHSEYEKRFGY